MQYEHIFRELGQVKDDIQQLHEDQVWTCSTTKRLYFLWQLHMFAVELNKLLFKINCLGSNHVKNFSKNDS